VKGNGGSSASPDTGRWRRPESVHVSPAALAENAV
jgi:hypothetical protein